MCEPTISKVSLHQKVGISVLSPLGFNLTEDYVIDLKTGYLKYRKKDGENSNKIERIRNNHTKVKKVNNFNLFIEYIKRNAVVFNNFNDFVIQQFFDVL